MDDKEKFSNLFASAEMRDGETVTNRYEWYMLNYGFRAAKFYSRLDESEYTFKCLRPEE